VEGGAVGPVLALEGFALRAFAHDAQVVGLVLFGQLGRERVRRRFGLDFGRGFCPALDRTRCWQSEAALGVFAGRCPPASVDQRIGERFGGAQLLGLALALGQFLLECGQPFLALFGAAVLEVQQYNASKPLPKTQ